MCRKNTGHDIYDPANIRKHFRKCFRWIRFYYIFYTSYVIVYASTLPAHMALSSMPGELSRDHTVSLLVLFR
jgi:hypothetical protein